MRVEELHIGDIVSNSWHSTRNILLQIVELNISNGQAKCVPINADVDSWPIGVTNHGDGLWHYAVSHFTTIVGNAITPIRVEELI